MAQLELIVQAVTDATHAGAIRTLLRRIASGSVLISVGYVREAGVEALEDAIRPVAARTRLFVGIRNDTTSVQAVKRLLRLRARVYAVDTGSRHVIFHPKLYLVVDNGEEAGLIIGSANLTHRGLHNNIEVSTQVTLDLHDDGDREFVERTIRSFDALLETHPRHVFQINTDADADALYESGRLVDETVIPAPAVVSAVRSGERDSLPPMKLHRVARPRGMRPVRRRATGGQVDHGVDAARAVTRLPISDYYLVWTSNALTKRDLNVPTGATTHRTGSMLWKKGAMEGIDQRHFFRDEVFVALTWTPDPKLTHLERARAEFELAVKNLNYGTFRLELTHNTRRNTKTYRQRNAMTGLHWGLARRVVARPDLLGRTMRLYRRDTNPPGYLIEID